MDLLSVDNVLGKYCHQLIKSKQALDVFKNYCFCLSSEISGLIENIMVTRYALPCEPTEAFVRHQCNSFKRLYFILHSDSIRGLLCDVSVLVYAHGS